MDFRANEYNQTSSLSNKQQRFLRSHKGPRGIHSSPFPDHKHVLPFLLVLLRWPPKIPLQGRRAPEVAARVPDLVDGGKFFELCFLLVQLYWVISFFSLLFFRCRSAVLSSLLSGGACPFARKAPGWLDAVGGMVAWNVSANFSLLWRRCCAHPETFRWKVCH